ncbi:hypothetical protein [Pontivivens ytuae]|uniref:Minor curlin subunit n=1 Tax=Pontivivens ytuae TaxID=2789856 RepID=A0A7S9LRC9_9RHOB|nr:hypothetical protein [Pontivivens ytuae]QPH53879.1 hypothetical protein I0K15_19230 [Pontivivens ytuae]
MLRFIRVAAVAGLAAFPAGAQTLDLPAVPQVTGVSVEQVVVSQGTPAAPIATDSGAMRNLNSVILQQGNDNRASVFNAGSPNANGILLQAGQRNTGAIIIDNSPGSVVGLVQIGRDNTMIGLVRGGRDNTVAGVQVGNNLTGVVGLENAENVTLTYGQAGASYAGGIIIRNPPPGSTITVN